MKHKYHERELIDFANAMLKKSQDGTKKPQKDGNHMVTHADISNWKESQKLAQ